MTIPTYVLGEQPEGDIDTVVAVVGDQLVFGDGARGARPLNGLADVLAGYRVGGGTAGNVADLAERAGFQGKAGETLTIPLPGDGPRRLVLLGTGGGATADVATARKVGVALARKAFPPKGGTVVVLGAGRWAAASVAALVEGSALASYVFAGEHAATTELTATEVRLVGHERGADAIDRARRLAAAACLARDLANTPASIKTPAWLAERATELAAAAGLGVRVRDESELAAEGFGGILAVGAGSVRPPRLVELTYVPDGATRRTPHIVLVGKGITFDTGGISIKPTALMGMMKTDMAGAGAVLAAMTALRELGVGVRVTGLLACAENMPSGTAMRPSDVITVWGGRTVEVLNTDAEGRLVLADALAYAAARLKPTEIVDLATLTGAVTVALGRRDAALYATDDRLARGLERAGSASGERVWRMPLVEDYRPALESDVADLAHIPRGGFPHGGSITAALFLREFTDGLPWAHLDIAGTGRAEGDDGELTKGATGYGVRLLLRWLQDLPASG